MKTVERLLAEQDRKAIDLLKKMLDRPALYLGINRFDYLYEFMNGYTFGHVEQDIASDNYKNEFNMMPDAIMQHWLLRTQMATLNSGSMQARELFWRCFGTKEIAFEHYKDFLNYPAPEVSSKHQGDLATKCFSFESPHIKGNIYWEISCFEKNHALVRYDWDDDIPADFYDNMARSLVDDVNALINSAGFTFDELRIYIRREPLFTQVRFLYRTSDGWCDDTEIILKDENHDVLISIIAKAQNCKTDSLENFKCEVFEQVDFSNNFESDEISNMGHLIADEKAFLSQYLRWKAN